MNSVSSCPNDGVDEGHVRGEERRGNAQRGQ